MIVICGLGWLNKEGYGCVKKSLQVYSDGNKNPSILPNKKEVFPYPFENFGRLDTISKMTCYAVGLALKDAGLIYPLNQKHDIGIVGTNSSGCVGSDVHYFKDYLDNGRTLGRGNLFIYTLPSSPLSEAAIYFGLQGPLFYVAKAEGSLAELMTMTVEMIYVDEVSMLLVGMADEEAAVFFVLARDSDFADDVLCDMVQTESILSKNLSFSEMIKGFSALKNKL